MRSNNIEKMKQKADAEKEKIELRSEKVRNLIGEIPPLLIRWGNTILLVILVLLAIIGWILFIGYRHQ